MLGRFATVDEALAHAATYASGLHEGETLRVSRSEDGSFSVCVPGGTILPVVVFEIIAPYVSPMEIKKIP
jgi:hypothetical protein